MQEGIWGCGQITRLHMTRQAHQASVVKAPVSQIPKSDTAECFLSDVWLNFEKGIFVKP